MPHFTFMNNTFGETSGWGFCVVGFFLILWLCSVVAVARTKTEDPFDRIVWLLIVLALNFVGTLLWLFFSGAEKSKVSASGEVPGSEADIKRRANEGTL